MSICTRCIFSKKKSTSDEFLVEKKSPLVLPPDFEMLPVPQNQQKNDNKNNKEKEIKNLLTDNDDISNSSTQNNSEPSSLEKSILEKIK